jgi:hypothetical protein
VNRPPAPIPAMARPMIRALLLCAVAHTKDLKHDVLVHARKQAPMHLPKLKNGNSGEEDVFDLICVSRRSIVDRRSRAN